MENEYEVKNPVRRGRGKPPSDVAKGETEVELVRGVNAAAAGEDVDDGNGETKPPLGSPGSPFVVSLDRSQKRSTTDQSLWVVIRSGALLLRKSNNLVLSHRSGRHAYGPIRGF